jgi:hypothetical protein
LFTTFDFEDEDNSTLIDKNKWTIVGGDWNIITSESYNQTLEPSFGSKSLSGNQTFDSHNGGIVRNYTNTTTVHGYVISTYSSLNNFPACLSDGANMWCVRIMGSGMGVNKITCSGGRGVDCSVASFDSCSHENLTVGFSANTLYHAKLIWNGTHFNAWIYDKNENLYSQLIGVACSVIPSTSILQAGFMDMHGNSYAYYDNLKSPQYVFPEPTIFVGSEEQYTDSDNDGIPDNLDVCPNTPGTFCHGCPEPTCSGDCAVPYCPDIGEPYCIADDSLCQYTTCPVNGCGVGTCYTNQTGIYTPAENTCELIDNTGTCTNNPCTLTCNFDKVCDLENRVKQLENQTQSNTERINILESIVNTILNEITKIWTDIDKIWNVVNQTTTTTTTTSTTTSTSTSTTTSTTSTTTTTGPTSCWSGSYQYLAKEYSQARKFCKCTMGSYGYQTIYTCTPQKLAYMYIDSGNNNNWNVTISNTTTAISAVICPNFQTYLLNKDYLIKS